VTRRRLVIVGAGGHGRDVHEVVLAVNDAAGPDDGFDVLGYLDDGVSTDELIVDRGLSVLGPVSELDRLPADVQYVVAVGVPAWPLVR
jgi:hypothetical protein